MSVLHARKSANESSKQSGRPQTGASARRVPVAPAQHLGMLQRQAGNQAVQALLRSGIIRAKLAVGSPDDPQEMEADRVADWVMRESAGGEMCGACQKKHPDQTATPPIIRRSAKTAASRSDAPASVSRTLASYGRPLDSPARSEMEARFGRGFGDVRVHTDDSAAESAGAIGALAYTVGNHIAFGRGQYAPQSVGGRHLLAHELTHTIQQRVGPGLAIQRKGATAQASREAFCPASATLSPAEQLQSSVGNQGLLNSSGLGANTGIIQRQPNSSSLNDKACFAPEPAASAEPQECSLNGQAKAEHPTDFDPCAVNVPALSNYELLAELNAAQERLGLGEDSEGFFDWRNLGRRLQAEISRRAQAGHVWLQSAHGEIPATLIRVSDNPLDGSMTVARVTGSIDAGEGSDIHLTPLLTEGQFEEFRDRLELETIRVEEYRRRLYESQIAVISSTTVTAGRLYNTALDASLIDPFSKRAVSTGGQPINKWLGRLGEAGYESRAASGYGYGVNDLNASPWVDLGGKPHPPSQESFPVFDFERRQGFARVLGTARISVKASGQATQAGRFEYYRRGVSEMYQTSGGALPTYISNQPQFAGQPTTGPQYEANRSTVLPDAYIAVNADDVGPFRDLLSNPTAAETPGGPALWNDTGRQPGQRPRASWRSVYEGVMREGPIRVNGVDYSSPAALDQARQSNQINARDYELAQREVGRRAASRVVSNGISTLELTNLRTARPLLNAIPEAQLPGLLSPEYIRSQRAGGGVGGEFTAAGEASVKGGGGGSLIAVVTTLGVMWLDEADHPNWERELATAGSLGALGGATGSAAEQIIISGGTRYLLNEAAQGTGGSLLTRGIVTTGGRFGGGGIGAGVVELASMGFFEDRPHSALEYTERTGRAFVIGGASTVVGAEAGAGAGAFTTAFIGAAAGTEVPIIGNIIGFIVGLGVGAFVYYEGNKTLPGGREDWDAAEAARQEGCQHRTKPTPNESSEIPYHCLARDSQVLMADGSSMAVQDVRPGDFVLGYDVSGGHMVPGRITKTIQHGRSSCMRIHRAEGPPLHITSEHPVALWIGSGLRWVDAGLLLVGQQLLVADQLGLSTSVQPIINITPADGEHDVFDLTVDSVHNLFADGVLVHNKLF